MTPEQEARYRAWAKRYAESICMTETQHQWELRRNNCYQRKLLLSAETAGIAPPRPPPPIKWNNHHAVQELQGEVKYLREQIDKAKRKPPKREAKPIEI